MGRLIKLGCGGRRKGVVMGRVSKGRCDGGGAWDKEEKWGMIMKVGHDHMRGLWDKEEK